VNLILLGFHGSGKTVVGRMLADRLWGTFVDVDETLAAQKAGAAAGGDGDGYLSAVQAGQESLLGAIKWDGQTVVAASSVAVPDGKRVESLKADCRFVYLKAEPAVLAQRIGADPARAKVSYSYFRRAEAGDVDAGVAKRDSAWSAMADLTLDTSPMTPETVVRLVIRMAM
jgi:shikimate kinase